MVLNNLIHKRKARFVILRRAERAEESLGKTEMLRGFAAQHDIAVQKSICAINLMLPTLKQR